jgi:response regulator RpfG family c-di-GMP phosphodiesterase
LSINSIDCVSGFEVLRSLRVSKVKTPILILTGLAAIEDKVRGFGFGADDYMTKPFHRNELVARIHAIVRRSKGHAQSVIQTGDLIVNVDTKKVEVNGAPVYLTGKEYKMLELLALRKGITITKETFLNYFMAAWTSRKPGSSTFSCANYARSLPVHRAAMSLLRRSGDVVMCWASRPPRQRRRACRKRRSSQQCDRQSRSV